MRRKALPPMVDVFECSTSVSLSESYAGTWCFATRRIAVDRAHTLIETPYVVVDANRFHSPSRWANTRGIVETGWYIGALGLIEDDAYNAVEKAVEALQADIDAGNIARGSHKQWIPPNPLEPPEERELRAYREQVLRHLEAGVFADADR